MPQFHETGYGKRFFDYQLPYLIKQITRIADALEEQNKHIKAEQCEDNPFKQRPLE